MLSKPSFTYYQPDRYYDDGTNVEYLGIPEDLFSFQAFLSEEECIAWLENNGYEPGDFTIHEYCDDDIEGVVIIDEHDIVIPKIESLSVDEIKELLTDEVLIMAGSIDNLHATRQSDETENQFRNRVYGEALVKVNAAIESIEDSGSYDFSSYGGHPVTDWYDEARDDAVRTVMNWMLEDYQYVLKPLPQMKRENLITEHLAMGILDTDKKVMYGVLNTANYDVMGYTFVAGDTSDCLEDVGCFPEDIELADAMDVGGVMSGTWPEGRAILIVKMKDDRLKA